MPHTYVACLLLMETAGGYHISCRMLHSNVWLSGRLRGWKAQCSSQEVLNSAVQLGEVQRSVLLNTSSCSCGGIIHGTGETCGLREKNIGNLLRDSASAEVFCTPGRWRAVSVISKTCCVKR